MSQKKLMIIGGVVALFTAVFAFVHANIAKIPFLRNADPFVVDFAIVIVGLLSAGILTWIMMKGSTETKKAVGVESGGGGAEAEEEVTDLDELIGEAEARLVAAQPENKPSNLPAILLIGEAGSAKTTAMVHSDTEPESLSGQVYEENKILPTPTANFWFAHSTLFVEVSGKLLGDAEAWKKLIGRLQPPKAAALLGTAEQAPRAVLVCVDAETLTIPSPDPLAISARKLRGQLAEISRLLGINLPVYVLFTRTDRLPFFAEYVAKMNNDEATRILGVTMPIVPHRDGIYAEQETNRLGAAFEKLFHSMCNARPDFLSREGRDEAGPLASIYEFPREFRKVRQSMVRFLVELCRPSQLTVGPFLRGFYFSGVRPVVVNEVAPAAPSAAAGAGGPPGATGIFRYGGAAQAAGAPQRVIGTRKVPQWLFLGHFFNDLLLADHVAKSASATSIRASLPRRILLSSAAALCLMYSIALAVSFRHNRILASDVKQAAQGIASVNAAEGGPASLDSLQKLETLRQSLDTLTKYNREGAPWSYRWGLYIGDKMYPDVCQLYFADFGKLLLTPTQNILVDFMKTLPNTPTGPAYAYTYDSLKAYLETTSNHDKATRAFLAPVLVSRWSENRNVEPARMQLAQKQFEFYSDQLKMANASCPLTSDSDALAIGKARFYLNLFAGLERVYTAMLADAAKAGQPINFNKRFPNEEVTDGQEVAAPFTKPGWEFMKAALKDPQKYFAGEPWVLGEQATKNTVDVSTLGLQLANRYYADYINQWRDYIKAAAVVRYAGVADAAKKLSVTSSAASPLLELFWLCSQNIPTEQPEIASAFQPVTTVVPTSNVDRYIAPSNQDYIAALLNLQATIDQVVQAGPVVSEASSDKTKDAASAAKIKASLVANTFAPGSPVQDKTKQLLLDPITYAEAVIVGHKADEINAGAAGVCKLYEPVMKKYPFLTSATTELTVAEINSIFHPPDGELWKFYNDKLTKLLPKQGNQYVPVSVGGVSLTPSFVTFFNNAAAFSSFVYAGNSADPHFTYTLKPVQSDGISSGSVQIDGQSFAYAHTDTPPKQFVWKPDGVHEAKATKATGGGSETTFQSFSGLWAVFRLFNEAETWTPKGSDNVLAWVPRSGKNLQAETQANGQPVTIRIELDMGGGPQIFSKGYFSRMACVAVAAK